MNLPNKIGIIGMGLIGGSITKALKKRAPSVKIASLKRDCLDLQGAVVEKAVDSVFSTWEELIAWSEVIILASPLSSLSKLANEIAVHCPKEKKLLVIDVSSVKKAVFPAFEALTTDNLDFLSTHPMAGKEKWGFANSEASLFQDCCWILSPHGKNQSLNIERATLLIKKMGARPISIDPDKHDSQVALISHLPALLSRLLLEFVETYDPEALQLAGPGFHSMTRLARDNPRLQSEIAMLNREELTKQLALWMEFISKEKRCRTQ
ncbi:MAG: prephenate dehydrogenase/arogenate dehydrogenase family protein [Verrucomicrobia bacterium]|nr:prephenate dehydrogenase/arogenate dehydrogenase family protein [Verrucomicrobiota bacterium]